MCRDDAPDPDPATPGAPASPREAELEAENARLLDELRRRARSMLAIVRSVARRSALTSEAAEDYAMHLEGRLGALARSQAMALRNPAGGVDLEEIIAGELLAHAALGGKRVSFSGPPVRLWAKAAQALGLAVHELAANAVKFGALSGAPHGHVSVIWQVKPGRLDGAGAERQRLRLEWRETGVALAAMSPRRHGFGTEVIERALAYELGATGALGFGPDGACCTVVLPLSEAVATSVPGL